MYPVPRSVTAWSPGHISGFFSPVLSENPDTTGSIGAGIAIEQGVTVTITGASRTTVHSLSRQNGILYEKYFEPPILKDLLHRLEIQIPLAITTECTLPLSSGFGLSASSLLALSYAVRAYCNLSLSDIECAMIAHEIEVLHRTGFGDVAGSMRGGALYRPVPGIRGGIIGESISYDEAEQITTLIFGPLVSDTILTSETALFQIKKAFPEQKPKTIEEFFLLSYQFAAKSGLMSEKVSRILNAAKKADIFASMTMLGDGVFALGQKGHVFLCAHASDPKSIFVCDIAHHGPRVMHIEE
jgi:pantoate kinase